ncbi:MAG: sugar-binding transcriptional regulator [Propioniciclava sp.]
MAQDRTSMLVKVARMYHEQGLRQPEIAEQLHLSQSRISRLLKEAVERGVVRTVVVTPPGSHVDLELAVRDAYGLADVVVVSPSSNDPGAILAALGSAGAVYLESTLMPGERIGLSSWSASLMAVVESMSPRVARGAERVVQILGGVGNTSVQVQATRMIDTLARATGGTAMHFPAPGVVASKQVRDALLADSSMAEVVAGWSDLTVALVGIGSVNPSPMLASSGNSLPSDDLDALRGLGAVGDVCLNFFDDDGDAVSSGLHDRILGIDAASLRAVPRKIAVAGGPSKVEAICAAARGRWFDVLITDTDTAQAMAGQGS